MAQIFKLAAYAAMAALVIAPSGDPLLAQARAPEQGRYCRAAPALPQLAAEADQAQSQDGGAVRRAYAAREDMASREMASPEIIGAEEAAPDAPPPPPSPPPPPAPPPPPPVPGYILSPDEITVTASAAEDRASESARIAPSPSSPSSPTPWPGPRPQSGQLTAGEHDDLLNPELYARYVRQSDVQQGMPDLPRVDTQRVLTVRVTNLDGQPLPMTNVMVRCSDGNRLTLATQADGTAVFFPGLDRLSPDVTITVGHSAQLRRVSLSDNPGGQSVNFAIAARPSAVRKLDLMLVIDTTGSMGDEIRFLQSELASIIGRLQASHPSLDIRVGFVFYRDVGDDYVTRTVGFGGDVDRAQALLQQQSASGGGDYPEAMDQAMIRAVGQGWRPDAIKTMLLVADAPPHNEQIGRTWAATEVARAARIHIVPVAASGVADEAEYVMRAMAAATQSRYLFLTDDSGIGNPHAPPAIDCYLVTRLDAMVRRVIDSQISGRRIEPQPDEVIRSVGNYDAGRCILPADFSTSQ